MKKSKKSNVRRKPKTSTAQEQANLLLYGSIPPRSLWSRKLRTAFRARRREIDRDHWHYGRDNGRKRNWYANREAHSSWAVREAQNILNAI